MEQSREFDVFTMNNEAVYGPELYKMSFGDAVNGGHLADYQVLVITTDETAAINSRNAAEYKETGLALDHAARLLGCWDALADPRTTSNAGRVTGTVGENQPLLRAIAYTNRISDSKKFAQHLSELGRTAISEATAIPDGAGERMLRVETRHIDGTQRADRRAATLAWLREDAEGRVPTSRTVVNARCLTEGVDVPALDAVLFLDQRRSQIDIIQAIGRVMRTSPGKEMGYIVLPVVVPDGADPDGFLSHSEFDKVWDVVKALRSHDERVDVWVNSVGMASNGPITVLPRHSDAEPDQDGVAIDAEYIQATLPLEGAIASKLVEKCGDRQYWPRWGQRAADISRRVTARINALTASDGETQAVFDDFANEMRRVVNSALSDRDLTEMLAHHIITRPVFESLFAHSSFSGANPVSQALDLIVTAFTEADPDLHTETSSLAALYASVATAMEGTATSEARLRVLLDVYESFFKAAMPDEVTRLGIAYTPAELVDFVLASADAAARKHFGRGLSDRNVHILDPFTGTGTFLYRLLVMPGLIRDIDLERKYAHEMHANEMLLLPYYLASVKIEEGYRERLDAAQAEKPKNTAFSKIVLTDTFEMGARHTLFTDKGYTAANSKHAREQNDTPMVVIVGNPPWSAGQKSAGDDNADISRPALEQRVRDTYGSKQKEITGRSSGGNSGGDLYVQAIRWASDRLGHSEDSTPKDGVIAFVHPNSLTNGTSLAGMRAALRDEFTDIYVINLRGDARRSGDASRAEGDKLFGQVSRSGVQLTVLVRDSAKPISRQATVHYAAVPEHSSLQTKLDWLAQLGNINGDGFKTVPVTDSHDWENLTDGTYKELIPVCTSAQDTRIEPTVFSINASGVKTNCDSYVYAFDYDQLVTKIQELIDAYESARHRVSEGMSLGQATRNNDLGSIKWTDTLKQSLKQNKKIVFDESRIREVLYRPFIKKWIYEDMRILSRGVEAIAMFSVSQSVSQTDRQTDRHENTGIITSSPSNRTRFSLLATTVLADLHALDPAGRLIPRKRS